MSSPMQYDAAAAEARLASWSNLLEQLFARQDVQKALQLKPGERLENGVDIHYLSNALKKFEPKADFIMLLEVLKRSWGIECCICTFYLPRAVCKGSPPANWASALLKAKYHIATAPPVEVEDKQVLTSQEQEARLAAEKASLEAEKASLEVEKASLAAQLAALKEEKAQISGKEKVLEEQQKVQQQFTQIFVRAFMTMALQAQAQAPLQADAAMQWRCAASVMAHMLEHGHYILPEPSSQIEVAKQLRHFIASGTISQSAESLAHILANNIAQLMAGAYTVRHH